METAFTSKYCSVSWSCRLPRPVFHGVRVDAERGRMPLRPEPSRSGPVAARASHCNLLSRTEIILT